MSRGKITDTGRELLTNYICCAVLKSISELQIGQFVLPPYGTNVVDESQEARYLRSYKEDLPEDHVSISSFQNSANWILQWFPMEYYEKDKHGGVHYHVFGDPGTPLYYKIPKDSLS
jgi:hypothetical protein